ncbi:DUF2911 domain-containing protein [Tenacibaculum sp. 1_MG-2023]|uniref:DUF2911 domain-containing protein n=1 Tax=Tenacibaculum sp. 1_MG-2023 TaxID=3062653 RepID=UPI0026E3E734|nr:DUF2911 domain-containing protein [Tenacibaculum sp. 1_MG-2023]MDO6674187.1 DUF2911 domain-containing protein [Tenacibaculum sp. 1_MG-2023]
MKKSILSIIVFAVALVFSNEVTAQKFANLDKSPMDAAAFPSSYRISDKKVKVVYSRPQLKGRSLAKLAPMGKVWRTGANEAAEITFYKEITFGGKKVKAGTYTLFTIPGEKEWTLILNTAKNVWGSYFYNESEDVARITAPTSKSDETIEAFSIAFDGEDEAFNMYIGWDNVIVTVPIKE